MITGRFWVDLRPKKWVKNGSKNGPKKWPKIGQKIGQKNRPKKCTNQSTTTQQNDQQKISEINKLFNNVKNCQFPNETLSEINYKIYELFIQKSDDRKDLDYKSCEKRTIDIVTGSSRPNFKICYTDQPHCLQKIKDIKNNTNFVDPTHDFNNEIILSRSQNNFQRCEQIPIDWTSRESIYINIFKIFFKDTVTCQCTSECSNLNQTLTDQSGDHTFFNITIPKIKFITQKSKCDPTNENGIHTTPDDHNEYNSQAIFSAFIICMVFILTLIILGIYYNVLIVSVNRWCNETFKVDISCESSFVMSIWCCRGVNEKVWNRNLGTFEEEAIY